MNQVRGIVHCDFARRQRITGRGVTVAILDTGVWVHHNDLESRVIGFKDFINNQSFPYDDNGHGTHVAGIIGGNGFYSRGRYMGIAPECNLLSIKVLDKEGNGNSKEVVDALDWIIANKERYQIKIVNISVGTMPQTGNAEKSILVQGVDKAWDAGLVVVVAAGNNGPKPMTITTPGISRKVITVGSSNDWEVTRISGQNKKNYSGRGPTPFCVCKPDIVAPGSNIISCNFDYGKSYLPYVVKSGTSMSTPIVSGAIALLMQKSPDITNKEVKMKLLKSGDDLGIPKNQQGCGLLNIQKLLS